MRVSGNAQLALPPVRNGERKPHLAFLLFQAAIGHSWMPQRMSGHSRGQSGGGSLGRQGRATRVPGAAPDLGIGMGTG